MNITKLLTLKKHRATFALEHKDFTAQLRKILAQNTKEGSTLTICVKNSDGKESAATTKLSNNDIALLSAVLK